MISSTRSLPKAYPPLPFHGIRTVSLISASIVSGILIYFCYHLKHDSYKIPWTFLVTIAASLLTLVCLLLTIIIHTCGNLSPTFNLLLNVPLLILWSVGFVLLAWNMYGTLGHVCDASNWGSSDGIMICQIYKALFSFTVIAWCAGLASVILDFRVRAQQMRLGKYDQMTDPNDGKEWDVKMDNLDRVNPTGHGQQPGQQPGQDDHPSPYRSDPYQPYTTEESTHRDDRRPQFGGNGTVNMNDFSYQAPVEQSMYDSSPYAHHDGGHYAHGARY